MQLSEIKIGQPLIFKSSIYGDTAVHVTSIYNEVVHFTIDGGEAAKQVRNFPELSDGKYFALASRLEKRPSKRDVSAARALAEAAKVINTIREVPGVGKVAFIEAAAKPSAPERKRRMSRNAALNRAREMADRNPTRFKWAKPEIIKVEETF